MCYVPYRQICHTVRDLSYLRHNKEKFIITTLKHFKFTDFYTCDNAQSCVLIKYYEQWDKT